MAQEQTLVRCGDIWCPAQAEGCASTCPYLGRVDGFRYSYCKLFSTPGPHSESRIAKVLGGSMAKVKDIVGRAERKLKRELVDEVPEGVEVEEVA